MNLSFAISVAVMLVGLVLYLLPVNGKALEVGRLMFAVGLLATLLKFAGHAALSIG